MFNIYVDDQSFLHHADFYGTWDRQIPVKAWCEEIEEETRFPQMFRDFTTYVCKDAWLKPEGSDEWSYVGPIRIVS